MDIQAKPLTQSHNPNILEVGEEGSLVDFNWWLIDKCQFKCTYCYATDFNKNNFFNKNMNHQSYKLVLHRLQTLDFDFEVSILGGEPTLHPNLVEIVHTLEQMKHCKVMSFFTNLTAGLKYYKQFDVEGRKLELNVSYHPEYHKRIFRKYLALHSILQHIKMVVMVNVYPKKKYYAQTREMIEKLKEHNIPFEVGVVRTNRFWDSTFDEGYEEFLDDVQNNLDYRPVKHLTTTGVEYLSEDYIFHHNISYYGYECEALNYTIEMDGSMRNSCMGNKISLTDNKCFVEPIICPVTTDCGCDELYHYKKTPPK